MLQIAPQEQFPIVRKLTDPNDSGTYYVRAVVRDSVTGSIIQIAGANFVNLTDGGSRRFSKVITAPSDVSGMGRWIDIVTSVYDDSGYATPSSVYGEEVETYLVAARFNPNTLNLNMLAGAGGVGQGPDIDYKKIRKIVEEVVKTIVIPEHVAIDYSNNLETILGAVRDIRIPEQEKVDFAPVLKAIADIPEPDPVDFSVVMEQLDVLNEEIKKAVDDLTKKYAESGKAMHEKVEKECKHLVDLSDSMTKFLNKPKLELVLTGEMKGEAVFDKLPKAKEEPEPEPDDTPERAANLLKR